VDAYGLRSRKGWCSQLQLKKFQVWNYKSFLDSGELEFGPGFNVLVGQNDSGKTALLEALNPNPPENKPHRSYATAPNETDVGTTSSRFRFWCSIPSEEAKRRLCSTGSLFMFTPEGGQNGNNLLSRLLAQPNIEIEWDTIDGWRNQGFGLWTP